MPSRILVYTGTDDGKTVTTTLIPAGAVQPCCRRHGSRRERSEGSASDAAGEPKEGGGEEVVGKPKKQHEAHKADWVGSQSAFVLGGAGNFDPGICIL